MTSTSSVSQLLQGWVGGDEDALRQLIPIIYGELRRLAQQQLRRERHDHTLQSAALVNEAFLRLVGVPPAELHNRAHFFAIASRVMRQILIQHARAHNAKKRQAGLRVDLSDIVVASPAAAPLDLIALDAALGALERLDARQCQVVEMKFFGGLSAPEISVVLGISLATVERDWSTARLWLGHAMQSGAPARYTCIS